MATIRQTKAAHKLSEIIRRPAGKKRLSLATVLKEAGYSDSVTRKPKLVTQRKGWMELMQNLLPDDLLIERLNNLVTYPLDVSYIKQGDEIIVKHELNNAISVRALDLAFKLKGSYSKSQEYLDEEKSLNKYKNLSHEDMTKLTFGMYELDDSGKVVLIDESNDNFWTDLSAYKQTLRAIEKMKKEIEESGVLPSNYDQF